MQELQKSGGIHTAKVLIISTSNSVAADLFLRTGIILHWGLKSVNEK